MYSTSQTLNTRLSDIAAKTKKIGLQKVMLAEYALWEYWSKITTCRFFFIYANNKENRRIGRAGQVTVERYGTRNLKLIPASKRPSKRKEQIGVAHYYDFKKRDWRGFRKSSFVVLLYVYDFKDKKWYEIGDIEKNRDKVLEEIGKSRVVG